MSFREFNDLCRDVWNDKFSFIMINRTVPSCEGRYIANFNKAYITVSGSGVVNEMLKKVPIPEMHLSFPKTCLQNKWRMAPSTTLASTPTADQELK